MRLQTAILAASLTFVAPLSVQADGFGLGVKAGTLGAGVEGTVSLADGLNVRIGANNFTYDYDDTVDDIDYDAELELSSYGVLLDWHPFTGAFRLTVGMLANGNELALSATPTGLVTIGNTTYPAALAGTLNGAIDFKKSAPYVGLGFGNAAGKHKGLGASFEIGALFQGSPDVTLSTTSSLILESDLRAEEQNIEDDLKNFKIYPVLAFGLSYQF